MNKKKLKQKGWHPQEIQHAESIMEKKFPHDVHFSKIVFYSALVVIVFANILVSLVLIPFLIALNKWALFALVIIFGGTIGFLYNFLITDIGHLQKKHHLTAAIIIPIIALANLVVMIMFSNKFIAELKINLPPHNPWITAGLFAVAFILPYLFSQLRK